MKNNLDIIKNIFRRFKDLTSIGIANIFAMIISALFWLYMATLIGEEGYGNIAYLISIAGIVGGISLLGASDTLVVFRAKDVKLQSTIFLIVSITGIIASLVTFLFIESKEVSVYIFGYVVFALVFHDALGSKNYRKYSIYLISQRILAVGLAIILYLIIGLEGIILGYALSFLPFSVSMYKTFKDVPINFQLLRPRFKFIINSYARSLMQVLAGSLDKLIIFPLFGASLLGNYYLGFQIFTILGIVPSIVFQYSLPQDSSGSNHIKLKKMTIFVSSIFSIVAIISAPVILPVFFSEFEDSVIIVQIMSVALIPSSISLMYTSKLLGNEKIKVVIIGQIIGLIVIIGGIYGLGNIFGIIGAAMGFTLGSISTAVYYVIITKTSKKAIM